MSLAKQLKQILGNELRTDPLELGYARYWDYPSQLAALLNNPRRKTDFRVDQVNEVVPYLLWVQNLGIINNVHLVLELVYKMNEIGTSEALADAVGAEMAAGLLVMLQAYGIDAFLNIFGITEYWSDKNKLHAALIEVLIHASTIGVDKYTVIISNEFLPPRVCVLFNGIAGAPNAVTEKDILEAKG